MSEHILLVDDDALLRRSLAFNLTQAGYRTSTAANAEDAMALARRDQPDLILLDLILPQMDGLEVCRHIREALNTPIIILTVKDEEIDRVVGLEVGADDYMGKPFSSRELVARVRAMLRRSVLIKEAAEREKRLTFRQLEVDLPTRTVKVDEEAVHLTPKEFDLLYCLASHPRRVFARDEILAQVWGYPGGRGDVRTVDAHVRRLRQKLERGRADHDWRIATVWGVGYRFDIAS